MSEMQADNLEQTQEELEQLLVRYPRLRQAALSGIVVAISKELEALYLYNKIDPLKVAAYGALIAVGINTVWDHICNSAPNI